MSSLVEPLTPPDLNDNFFNAHNTQFSGPISSTNNSSTVSTPLNSNIGGNTFRSRFKSLPLVNELDQKFNQFNISNLQNLSQNPTPLAPSSSTPYTNMNSSNSSIPQIPLQQFQLPQQQSHQNLPQRQRSSALQQAHQHHSSMPSVLYQPSRQETSTAMSTPATPGATSSSSYKNYDELNLIPIEKLDVLKLSIDQYGCRFLQKKLEMDNSIKDVIFNKIFNNMIDLIVDPFGNYLVQKLVDYLSSSQKDLMIEKIHTYLFLISINQYGTRSLQKIIDRVSNTYQMDLIIKGLQLNDTTNAVEDNNIVKLIKDLNGNHVIQKCIFKFPPEKFQFIIDSICLNNNIVRISTHKHGCCVLQKLLNNADFNQIMKISQILLVYLDELINDQFGNYIIQFLFELNFLKSANNVDFLIDDFFNKMYKNLIPLSCLKFSSNVIEKLIKILKFKQNYFHLNEIIKLINANFEILIKDKFGNYVIQTLIDQFYDVSELNLEMNILITTVKNYLPVIKAAPYARKIQLKIQQLESNYSLNSLNTPSSINSSSSLGFDNQGKFVANNMMMMNNNNNNLNTNMLNSSSTNFMNYNINPYFPTDNSVYNNSNTFVPGAGFHANNNVFNGTYQ